MQSERLLRFGILCAFMAFFIISGTVSTNLSPLMVVAPLNDNLQATSDDLGVRPANGSPLLNDTYSGMGGGLEYESGANASATLTNATVLNEPTLTATETITVPDGAKITDLNVTLREMNQHKDSIIIVNQSLTLSPNYTIAYTANANAVNRDINWVNMTVYDAAGARIGVINLYIDDILNTTKNGAGIHNVGLNFSQNGIYDITIEFRYSNGSWFTNQSIIVARSILPRGNAIIPNTVSTVLNPYIRLNDAISYPYLAVDFTLPQKMKVSGIEIYGRLNVIPYSQNQIKITIRNRGYIITYYPTSTVHATLNYPDEDEDAWAIVVPQWLQFDFNESIELSAGSYMCRIDGNVENVGNNYYLDVYTTTTARDSSQHPSKYNGISWAYLDNNLLFKVHTEEFIATNLSKVSVNATLISDTLQARTQPFTPAKNRTYFKSTQGGPWTATGGEFSIIFTANATVEFKIAYVIGLNWTNTSRPCTFTAKFKYNIAAWQTWIKNALQPMPTGGPTYISSTFRYTVNFPNAWFRFNGSAPASYFTQSLTVPRLYINSSVATLNWTFKASSPDVDIELTTPDDRTEFSLGMAINCTGLYPALQYNTTLSFWNASYQTGGVLGRNVSLASFMQYNSIIEHKGINASIITQFPSFHIPETYANTSLTARIWWHNTTAVGIQLVNYFIKQYATLENLTYVSEITSSQNFTMAFRYRNAAQVSISGAIVTTNWLAGNWSERYTSGVYYVDFKAYNTAGWGPGTVHNTTVYFSHPNYIGYNYNFQLYISAEGLLEFVSGHYNIPMNATQHLWFRWYTAEQARISYDHEDTGLLIDIRYDGVVLGKLIAPCYYVFDWEAEYPAANLHIILQTKYYGTDYYLGQHVCNVDVKKVNETYIIARETYNFFFQVIPNPTYLTFESSSAYKVSGHALSEFEDYDALTRVSVIYQCNATDTDDWNNRRYFRTGDLYAYLYDYTHGANVGGVKRMTSLYNGSYIFEFETLTLSSFNSYGIIVFSNTTNFQDQSIMLSLTMMPRRQIVFEIPEMTEITEKKILNITGQAFYQDAYSKWSLAGGLIDITVVFYGAGVKTEVTFQVKTDASGRFTDAHLTSPENGEYVAINVTIAYGETRINEVQTVTLHLEIKVNIFSRYIVPVLIVLAVILIGVPLFINFIWPFMVNNIPRLQEWKSQKQLDLIEEQKPPSPLLTMRTLRIPKLELQGNSVSGVSNKEVPEFEEIKITPDQAVRPEASLSLGEKIRDRLIKNVKDLDIVRTGADAPTDLSNKAEYLRSAVMFERTGKFYDAIVNYQHAKILAEKLDLQPELNLYQQNINRILIKMNVRDQILFLKTYALKQEEKQAQKMA